VVSVSSLSKGTILTPNDEAIQSLQNRLRHSFWPEMLMDDCEHAEIGHPISMAKDFGLLDLSYFMGSSPNATPPLTTSSFYSQAHGSMAVEQHYATKSGLEGSPISVARHFA
jgi:hypothetical protein